MMKGGFLEDYVYIQVSSSVKQSVNGLKTQEKCIPSNRNKDPKMCLTAEKMLLSSSHLQVLTKFIYFLQIL